MLGDRRGVESWLDGMDGATLIRGHARFEDPHTIRVDDRVLRGDKIFLNVGGRAVAPDMPGGLSDIDYLTNVGILELDTVPPEHLVIVGGSYIALEFAQMYRRFGAHVTVIEKGPRLTSREDEDVSAAIKEILEAEGIDVVLDATAIAFTKRDSGFEVVPREGAEPIAARICCSRSAGHPTPTTSAWTPRVSRPTPAVTSSSTTSCAPTSSTSGRWGGTATARARSPTRPTTTSRSWPRTSSTTTRAGSATAS